MRATISYLSVVLISVFLFLNIIVAQVEGTLTIISELNNETVFSTEETGIDSASAYGLKGHLVIAHPLDACSIPDPPPAYVNSSLKDWILLATVNFGGTEGGDCSLAQKTKYAQVAGYSAIVLRRIGANDTEGVIPSFIGLDWLGVRIYACILGDDIAAFIEERYTYPHGYLIQFENEPYFPIGLLANIVIVGFLGILTLLLLLRLFHYLYFSVTTRVVERRRRKKTLLSSNQLKKLPVLKWTPNIPQDTCSICIELFEPEEEIRVLPCSHVFHKNCVDPWLLKESRKCPNCKGRVLFPNERGRYTYSSDSSEGEEQEQNERTPLLRSRENYRFIDTLTESHNTRALASSGERYQYLQDQDEQDETATPSKRPKVTFAPAVSVSSRSNHPRTANAFVLPMGVHKKVRSPSLKKTSTTTAPTITEPMVATTSSQSHSTPDFETASKLSSTSSSDTLIDFDEDEKENSMSAQSFHSCQGFEAFGNGNANNTTNYGSFKSFSSQD